MWRAGFWDVLLSRCLLPQERLTSLTKSGEAHFRKSGRRQRKNPGSRMSCGASTPASRSMRAGKAATKRPFSVLRPKIKQPSKTQWGFFSGQTQKAGRHFLLTTVQSPSHFTIFWKQFLARIFIKILRSASCCRRLLRTNLENTAESNRNFRDADYLRHGNFRGIMLL